MKINIYIFLYLIIFINQIFANEIELKSDNIIVLENGNIIKSYNSDALILEDEILIKSNEAIYNKKKQELTVIGNVFFDDKKNNIQVNAEKAIINKNQNIVFTIGNTLFNFEKKYKGVSENVFYDLNKKHVYSENETIIEDNSNNIYNFNNKFLYDIKKDIIFSKETDVIDSENNKYTLSNVALNLKSNEIAGKNIKVDFIDSYFGDENNDPILKGRSIISNDKKTEINKAVFSTCNIENKKCPDWEFNSKKFTHDKENKIFIYEDSWLKIFGQKLLYTPYMSHPDPSVKRKSGFLTPMYGNSGNLGQSLVIPYFKVLSEDKDLTFNPKIYADDKFIIQNEYRQAFENSKLITDFSLNNDGKNSNNHLFTKLEGSFSEKTDFVFNYQRVNNDTYLKKNNLTNSSDLIESDSLLTSSFNLDHTIDDRTNFNLEFIAYEDLTRNESDRFQYIFPNVDFNKEINIPDDYNGSFTFSSTGYQKEYDTNKYEALLINDFLFSSDDTVYKKGYLSNYQILLKNFNSYSENSTTYNDKEDYQVLGSLIYNTSFPLVKQEDKELNYLKPILSLRYSPNGTKDISSNDLRLSYDNIFALDRISSESIVEGGKSIVLGLEYERHIKDENNFDRKIFGLNLANSISKDKDSNLPTKSKLNQTRSDIVGNLTFKPVSNISLDYDFSIDRDLDDINYNFISTKFNFNKISTEFDYLQENEDLGNAKSIKNSTVFNFKDQSSFEFNASKNLKTDFTEYYNFIYKYKSDCLSADFSYNKTFYKDTNLDPDESLMFTIRFIPFAEIIGSADTLINN